MNSVVIFKLSKEDKLLLKKRCAENRISLSAYIRLKLFS